MFCAVGGNQPSFSLGSSALLSHVEKLALNQHERHAQKQQQQQLKKNIYQKEKLWFKIKLKRNKREGRYTQVQVVSREGYLQGHHPTTLEMEIYIPHFVLPLQPSLHRTQNHSHMVVKFHK